MIIRSQASFGSCQVQFSSEDQTASAWTSSRAVEESTLRSTHPSVLNDDMVPHVDPQHVVSLKHVRSSELNQLRRPSSIHSHRSAGSDQFSVLRAKNRQEEARAQAELAAQRRRRELEIRLAKEQQEEDLARFKYEQERKLRQAERKALQKELELENRVLIASFARRAFKEELKALEDDEPGTCVGKSPLQAPAANENPLTLDTASVPAMDRVRDAISVP